MAKKLTVSIDLLALGSTEEEQIPKVVEFLRILADEFEDHKRFGTGENPCTFDDANKTIAVYTVE